MKDKESLENKLYFGKYQPYIKIGEGSFGIIFAANNITNNEKFALKLENKNTGQNLLESEAYVLSYLKGPGIPSVKSYGFSGDYNILVMELLDKSLEEYFQKFSMKFTMKTVCMLGDQMIQRLEYIHNKHIIHRDMKPDNFVMGIDENSHMVYLIDFGLAKKYRSSRTLQHIRYSNNKKLTGTARYASINALRGVEQSRRDDLEAVGYVLMYFLRGALPWQGLKVDKKEDRYKKIYEKKKSTTAEELCEGFPAEFATYINYTRNLGFEEDPNYDYLRGLFRKVLETQTTVIDFIFDWTSPEEAKTNRAKLAEPLPISKEENKDQEKEKGREGEKEKVNMNPKNNVLQTLNSCDREFDNKFDKDKLRMSDGNLVGLNNAQVVNTNENLKANRIVEQPKPYKFMGNLNTDNVTKPDGPYVSKTPRVQSNQFSSTVLNTQNSNTANLPKFEKKGSKLTGKETLVTEPGDAKKKKKKDCIIF